MWSAALLYFRILSEWQLCSFTFKKAQAPGRVVPGLTWWPVLELQGVRVVSKPARELASPKKTLRIGCTLSMSISGQRTRNHFSLKNVQVFTVTWRLMLKILVFSSLWYFWSILVLHVSSQLTIQLRKGCSLLKTTSANVSSPLQAVTDGEMELGALTLLLEELSIFPWHC